MQKILKKEITINAGDGHVWNALTNPDVMVQWMGEPEMKMQVITTWDVGSSLVIKGFHHTPFANKGIVIKFVPTSILEYSYLSSLSRLPNRPENYTLLEFLLTPVENQTLVQLNIRGFPTETIYRHVDFYWTSTLILLKQTIEKNASFSVN